MAPFLLPRKGEKRGQNDRDKRTEEGAAVKEKKPLQQRKQRMPQQCGIFCIKERESVNDKGKGILQKDESVVGIPDRCCYLFVYADRHSDNR